MDKEEAIANLEYLISEDCTDTQHDYVEEIKLAINALEKQKQKEPMPTIETAPVVRCERCRYWHRYSSSSRKGRCSGLILYLNGEMETPEDFFCKDGEER